MLPPCKEYGEHTWCPHTFEPPSPPLHLWALSPTVALSITPQEMPVRDLCKGQNYQVADKCIDTTFTISILQTSLLPFPYTRRAL